MVETKIPFSKKYFTLDKNKEILNDYKEYEKNFEEKIKLLREKASDPNWLHFAIGYYHDADSGNLRLAMRYADERMYKDKNKFYEQYPDKRR